MVGEDEQKTRYTFSARKYAIELSNLNNKILADIVIEIKIFGTFKMSTAKSSQNLKRYLSSKHETQFIQQIVSSFVCSNDF